MNFGSFGHNGSTATNPFLKHSFSITCHVMVVGFAAVRCNLLDLTCYSHESLTC